MLDPSRKLLKEGAIPTLNLVPEVPPVIDTQPYKHDILATPGKRISGRKFKTPYHDRLSPTYPFFPPAHLHNVAVSRDTSQLHSKQLPNNELGSESTTSTSTRSLERKHASSSRTDSIMTLPKQDSLTHTKAVNFINTTENCTRHSVTGSMLCTRLKPKVEERHNHSIDDNQKKNISIWKGRNFHAVQTGSRSAASSTTTIKNVQNTLSNSSSTLTTGINLRSRRNDNVVVIADGHNSQFSSMSNPRLTFAPEHCMPQPPKLIKTRLLPMYPLCSNTTKSQKNPLNSTASDCLFVESKISQTKCCEKSNQDGSATLTYSDDYFQQSSLRPSQSSLLKTTSKHTPKYTQAHLYGNKTFQTSDRIAADMSADFQQPSLRPSQSSLLKTTSKYTQAHLHGNKTFQTSDRFAADMSAEFNSSSSHYIRQRQFRRCNDDMNLERTKTSGVFSDPPVVVKTKIISSSISSSSDLDIVGHTGKVTCFPGVEHSHQVDNEYVDVVRVLKDTQHVCGKNSLLIEKPVRCIDDQVDVVRVLNDLRDVGDEKIDVEHDFVDTDDELIVPRLERNNKFDGDENI